MPPICFVKDVLFLELVLGFIILFNVHGRIDIWMGGMFMVLYVLYVVLTVVMPKPPNEPAFEALESQENGMDGALTKPLNETDSDE